MPGVELRITDDSGDGAAVGRRVARRDRGARPVDHRRRTTTSTIPRSSTTAGCAPATSPGAAQRLRDDQRPRQGRDQVRRRVGVVGRSREHADGPSRRARGGRHRRARRPLGRAPAGLRRARSPTSHVTADELRAWLAERTAKFWLPERWAFITEVPKTSVGKFDKKVLRARHAAGELDVEKIA